MLSTYCQTNLGPIDQNGWSTIRSWRICKADDPSTDRSQIFDNPHVLIPSLNNLTFNSETGKQLKCDPRVNSTLLPNNSPVNKKDCIVSLANLSPYVRHSILHDLKFVLFSQLTSL